MTRRCSGQSILDSSRNLRRLQRYQMDGVAWRLLPGAEPCGTRGPHGALPAFRIADFGIARGYCLAHDVRIVFEEMLPGMSLLIFLDPDATPFELAQVTDPKAWKLGDRRELRTRRRQDVAPSSTLPLLGLEELTIYAYDVTASVRFYRDILGLPVGLSFFGHIHLVAANTQVVLRPTNWRCRAPAQPHATEPVFAIPDLEALIKRLRQEAIAHRLEAPGRILVEDPAGLRIHCEAPG